MKTKLIKEQFLMSSILFMAICGAYLTSLIVYTQLHPTTNSILLLAQK
jgi:hypothetical protein